MKTIEERAYEVLHCAWSCSLSGEELQTYVHDWLSEGGPEDLQAFIVALDSAAQEMIEQDKDYAHSKQTIETSLSAVVTAVRKELA